MKALFRTIVAAALLAASAAAAECAEKVTVKLKSGRVYDVDLISETETSVELEVDGTRFNIDKADIAEMKREKAPAAMAQPATTPAPTPPAAAPALQPGGATGAPGASPQPEPEISEELRKKVDALLPKLSPKEDPSNVESRPDVAAAGELRAIKGPGVDRHLLRAFEKAQGVARLHLASILAERKVEAVIPTIAAAIDSAGLAKTPRDLIRILGDFRCNAATAVLLKHLPNAKGPALIDILSALTETEDVKLLPTFLPYLDHGEAGVRGVARVAVIRLGKLVRKMPKPPFDVVGECLKRIPKSPHPGSYAVVFTYIGDERADKPLLDMLESKDSATLELTAFAVGERAIPAAKDRLVAILADQEAYYWRTRQAAVNALIKLKDVSVVPELIELVGKEKNTAVAKDVYKALKLLTGQGKIPSSAATWKNWWDENGSKLGEPEEPEAPKEPDATTEPDAAP